MKIKIELTNEDVKQLIVRELADRVGNVTFKANDVKIKVRSKQNYRDREWEIGEFQVTYEGDV